jgi:hypothetical protein
MAHSNHRDKWREAHVVEELFTVYRSLVNGAVIDVTRKQISRTDERVALACCWCGYSLFGARV